MRRNGRTDASPASIQWPTCSASAATEPPAWALSLLGAHFRTGNVELRRLLGPARMDLDGERHAHRPFQKYHFVLEAVGAENEIGERLVGDNLLARTAG